MYGTIKICSNIRGEKLSDMSMHTVARIKQSWFERLFCTVWIAVIGYMIVWPVTNNNLLMRIIWIPAMLIVFAISIPKVTSRQKIIEIAFPAIILFFSLITQQESGDSAHLFAAFSYIGLLLLTDMCSRTILTKKTFDFVFYSNVILSAVFILYSFTPIAYRVHTNGRVWYSIYYVFDLGNSNFAAMVLFSFYCVLMINLAYRRHKFLIILLIMCVFYLIIRTNCRSAIVSALIVALAYILLGKRKIPFPIIIIGCVTPAIFVYVYLSLYQKMGGERILFYNKTLFSGRQDVFINYLSYIRNWKHIIFGNFAEAGLQNAHNSTLSVFSSLGLVGIIGFYSFYLRILSEIQHKDSSKIRSMCIICILAFFVQSSMEASYFLGGFPGIMFLSTFVLLANYTDYSAIQV